MWTVKDILNITEGTAHALEQDNLVSQFFINTQLIPESMQENTLCIFVAVPPLPNNHGGLYIPKAEAKNAIVMYDDTTPIQPSQHHPAIKVPCTQKALLELAQHHFLRLTGKKILVTGSQGKTTTKETLKALTPHAYATEKNFNTHVSLCLTILAAPVNAPLYIFEVGISRMQEMSRLMSLFPEKSFDAAVITSISPTHIEHLLSVENIINEKTEIFKKLKDDGCAIYEGDRPYSHTLHSKTCSRTSYVFGEDAHCTVSVKNVRVTQGSTQGEISYQNHTLSFCTHLLGVHMCRNIAGALTALLALNIYTLTTLQKALDQLRTFFPTAGRGEIVPFRFGHIFDYSYAAANLVAVEANLKAFFKQEASKRFIVMGDLGEQGAARISKMHNKLRETIENYTPDRIYVIGPHLQKAMPPSASCLHMSSFEDITKDVIKNAQKHTKIFIQGGRVFALEKLLSLLEKT